LAVNDLVEKRLRSSIKASKHSYVITHSFITSGIVFYRFKKVMAKQIKLIPNTFSKETSSKIN